MGRRIAIVLVAAATLAPAGSAGGAVAAAVRAPAIIRHFGRAATQSTNWSGYAAYGSGVTFTDVKGTWTEPTATCTTGKATYSSFWVGIDGYNSNSVEQLGTDTDCTSTNAPKYYAWYEMYPAASQTISGFTVHPGDRITAEVARSASTYTLSMTDVTSGQTFSTQKSSSGLANSSAEWVAEAPSSCFVTCSVLPLTNFGTVHFRGSYATGNGHRGTISDAAWSHDEITMVTNNGTVKAQPSGLNSAGTAFSVTWHHS